MVFNSRLIHTHSSSASSLLFFQMLFLFTHTHIVPICSKLFLCEIFNFDKLGRARSKAEKKKRKRAREREREEGRERALVEPKPVMMIKPSSSANAIQTLSNCTHITYIYTHKYIYAMVIV